MSRQSNAVPASPQPYHSIPRPMYMTFDTIELQGMSATQRANTVKHLASLLMQAAGIAIAKEYDDDER